MVRVHLIQGIVLVAQKFTISYRSRRSDNKCYIGMWSLQAKTTLVSSRSPISICANEYFHRDISKRATTNNKQIAFIVKAYIIYQPTCNDKCKTANAASLKSDIDAAIRNAAFNGIQIVINGEILDFTVDISVDDVLFMSDIGKTRVFFEKKKKSQTSFNSLLLVSDSDQNYISQPIPDMNTYVCNPNPVVETNTTTTTSSSSVFSATQSIG